MNGIAGRRWGFSSVAHRSRVAQVWHNTIQSRRDIFLKRTRWDVRDVPLCLVICIAPQVCQASRTPAEYEKTQKSSYGTTDLPEKKCLPVSADDRAGRPEHSVESADYQEVDGNGSPVSPNN